MSQQASDTRTSPLYPDMFALVCDGKGTSHDCSPGELPEEQLSGSETAFRWVHLHRDNPETIEWLRGQGIDSLVLEALLAEETRPRCTVHGDGVILILRGVNLNPGAEPEDMVSVRLWIDQSGVIGIWRRPLMAVRDLLDDANRHNAPHSPGDLVAKLALRLADRAEPLIATLNEQLDDLEEAVLDETVDLSRGPLARIRRMAIVLRRFMFPQRDALTTLEIESLSWLTDRDRSRIREAADRITRLGEELDAIRDRAQVVHDQVLDKRSETMNRRMLVLAVATAFFLPLGLLTGLLGINVGGIPGADVKWAFGAVCGLIVVIGAVQYWLFRHFDLMR